MQFSKIVHGEEGEIETDHIELARDPFSLVQVACDLIDIVSFRCENPNLEFVVDCDPVLVNKALAGDVFRFKQCLLHIIDNAIKAREKRNAMCCFSV